MPGLESVPDPDRDDSPVSPSQAPPVMSFCWLRHFLAVISNIQVFDPDSTEESDDAEETQDEGHGYEPISQEEAFGDGSEEQEELAVMPAWRRGEAWEVYRLCTSPSPPPAWWTMTMLGPLMEITREKHRK